ncbi:MAG TPA: hypothetical protein VGL59_17130 [Polyangia bacterium]
MEFATAAGSSVLTSNVQTVTFKSFGDGLHGRPPLGAACDDFVWSFTVSLEQRRLQATRCRIQNDDSDNPQNYLPTMDDITLDETGPFQTVRAAIQAVTISDRGGCSDADTRELGSLR